MTLIRKLVLAACSVLLCLSYSASNAQTATGAIDQTTGNLITTNGWTGIGAYAPDPNNCCSNPAGSQPLYDTSSGIIKFSYGQATVQQSIAVNKALEAAGTGIQVNGYSWGYDVRNMNGHGGQGGTDSLTVTSWLKDTSGQNLLSTSVTYNTLFDWTSFSGTQTLGSPASISNLSTVGIAFSGKDSGFWAGLYGPEVRNVSLRLNYGVDPCATNPAYGPQCAGFSSIIDSVNLVPNPDAYGVFGSGVNNSFAINQALSAAGTGIAIHGFRWGYVANANGPYCNSWDMGWLGCWDFRVPSVSTNVNITSSTGATIYNVDRTYTNSYNTTSYSYLFPASRPVNTLGNFNFTATTNDVAYVGSMWSKAIYTPDPCVTNPASSPTCPGYLKAIGVNTTTDTSIATTDTGTTTSSVDPVIATTTPTTTPTTTTAVATTSPTSTTSSTTDVAQPTTTTTSSSTTTSPTTTTATAATTSVTPSATNPQPKVGEISVAGSQATSSKSSMSTSQLLSIVNSEQSRVSKLEMSTAQSAVEQAKTESAKVTSEAQAVAAAQQAQTLSNAQAVVSTVTANQTQASTFGSVGLQSSGSGIGLFAAQTSVVSIGGLRGPDTLGSQSNALMASMSMSNMTSSANYTFKQDQEINRTKNQELPTNETKQVSSLTNPLNMSLNSPLPLAAPAPAPTGSVVNKNVKDNDAAGGVTIANIAKQPAGFELYMNSMKDVAFYPPKEIYRNQKVVDNARAQRLLSGASDQLHQRMVDLQYNNNKGN